MERPVKGDVVVVPFPFSDLSGVKRRPALVLSVLPGQDLVLCQITSKHSKSVFSLSLTSEDFSSGGLPRESMIRADRIFTAQDSIVLYRAGTLQKAKLSKTIDKTCEMLRS